MFFGFLAPETPQVPHVLEMAIRPPLISVSRLPGFGDLAFPGSQISGYLSAPISGCRDVRNPLFREAAGSGCLDS